MDVLAASEARIPDDDGNQEHPLTRDVQASDGSSETDNKFQKAIAFWRAIDFTTLIPKLDATASEVIGQQKDALVERKEVAQKTKDFRKLEDTEKLTDYKALLKSYQVFIDLLTSHNKASSSAFLQLYSSLSDAPDPFPLLEASVDSLVLSEDTVPKLTKENEILHGTVRKLTAQLEETEARLGEARSGKKQVEDGRDERIKEVESTWSQVVDEKQSNWDAKEKSLEEKIENQDRLLRELKASYEVAQRLGRGDNAGIELARSRASAAELEMLSSELEKTSTRLAEIEARNEQLRLDLARAISQTQATQNGKSLEEDPAYLSLQSENSSLLRKLDTFRLDKDGERRTFDAKLRQVERQHQFTETENQDLKSKVQKWADYDEIKRELDMLRSIELYTGDDDNEGNDFVESNGSAQPERKETLEQLLMGKNKKMSNELTVLRMSHQALQTKFGNLETELAEVNAELEKSQKLSSTLENDLLRFQEEASNGLPSSGASIAGTFTSRYPQSTRRGRASPTSSIISGYETVPRPTTLESLRAGEPVGGGSGILPMIQAQRDRFKQKNSQLEEELSKTYATVTSLRQEISSLQKDNLNLYEKTRYVSTYSRGQPTTSSSSSAYGNAPSHNSTQLTADQSSSSSDRYKTQYEAHITPFAAFRGRESVRAYKQMSLPERIVFSITRMVLATRMSRNLFAAYCLALHLLVFLMLYWMGITDIEMHGPRFAADVAGAAGGAAVAAGKQAAAVAAAAAPKVGAGAGVDGDTWHQEGFG